MRTRSFPGFDDDFSDIIAPEAAATTAAVAPGASVGTSDSVGWFHDDDVEQIYECLLLSLVHHAVPPVIDAQSVTDALAGSWGLGFGVWGLGFGVWGLGFGVWV